MKGLFTLPAFAVLGKAAGSGRTLVMLHLAGGNDGLNTVVPLRDAAYKRLRPALALRPAETLEIDRGLAFHNALQGLKRLYESGHLAVVNGVGYPNLFFYDFAATEIWEAADPRGGASGWIGRFLDETRERRGLRAVALGNEQPPLALASSSTPPVTLDDPRDFAPPQNAARIREMYAAYAREGGSRGLVGEAGLSTFAAAEKISTMRGARGGGYPAGPLGADLQRAADLVASDLGVEVLHLSFGGFDTHVNQPAKHRQLLRQVGDAIAAFQQDVLRRGVSKRVAVMVFSEFGRRPAENFGGGTDHGSAGPVFVVADGVRGGLHGEYPSLSDLDNGNLRFTTDFRSVYAAIIRDCFKADPVPVVGKHAPLALFG